MLSGTHQTHQSNFASSKGKDTKFRVGGTPQNRKGSRLLLWNYWHVEKNTLKICGRKYWADCIFGEVKLPCELWFTERISFQLDRDSHSSNTVSVKRQHLLNIAFLQHSLASKIKCKIPSQGILGLPLIIAVLFQFQDGSD